MLACMLHLLLLFKVLCHAHSTQMACCAKLSRQCLRGITLYGQHSQLQYKDLDSMHAALQCLFVSWCLALAWNAGSSVLNTSPLIVSKQYTDQGSKFMQPSVERLTTSVPMRPLSIFDLV